MVQQVHVYVYNVCTKAPLSGLNGCFGYKRQLSNYISSTRYQSLEKKIMFCHSLIHVIEYQVHYND